MSATTAHIVAEYFLALADEDSGDTISNLKLQKLLYYAQGFYLAMNGSPLFTEQIRAWEHGPVVPSVYHVYKDCEAASIPKPMGIDFSAISKDVRAFLDEIWSVFGQFSAWKLRNMTHNERPWKDTEAGGVIRRSVMTMYFTRFIKD